MRFEKHLRLSSVLLRVLCGKVLSCFFMILVAILLHLAEVLLVFESTAIRQISVPPRPVPLAH